MVKPKKLEETLNITQECNGVDEMGRSVLRKPVTVNIVISPLSDRTILVEPVNCKYSCGITQYCNASYPKVSKDAVGKNGHSVKCKYHTYLPVNN